MRKFHLLLLISIIILLLLSPVLHAEDISSYQITDSPLTLTIHMYIEDYSFKDNWPVFRKAAELTNIKLKGTAPSSATNSEEVFNMMISSGKLSDIVQYNREELNQYGMKGAFIPLNQLIGKYAPNFSNFLKKRSDVKRLITAADGNIYYIPHVRDGEVARGWFIRQDWLDKLNLDRPDTVGEYYQVLKEIKEGDPNGNGIKDEIPFFARHTDYGINGLLILWKARSSWYAEDGRVLYGPYTPEYKTALINIAKWYKEGLIDPQIYTRGLDSRKELLSDNLGGSTHDWFGSTALFNDKLKDNITGFKFLPIAPPAGIDGVRRENSKRSIGGEEGWAISYSNSHPVETIKFFDFFWTEYGRKLMNFGIKGITYEMFNGKPEFQNWLIESDRNILDILYEDYGAQQRIGFQQDFSYEEQWMTPTALDGINLYRKNDFMLDQFPNLTFTEEEYKMIYTLLPDIESYVEEMRERYLLGAENVEESFDSYLANLKKMGIEQLIDIYQKAYQRYINSK